MTSTVDTDSLHGALARVRATAGARKSFLTYEAPDGRLRELRYGELWDRAARLRRLLADRGLEPGARVVVASADDAAVVTVVLACLEAGLSAVVVDPDATAAEAEGLAAVAEPALLVVDAERGSRWPTGAERLRVQGDGGGGLFRKLLGRRRAAPAGGTEAFPGVLEGVEPTAAGPAPLARDAEAYVLFTSGSTARPKGVRVSRGALLAHAATLARHLGYDAGARLLTVLPLHGGDGFFHGFLTAYLAGAAAVRPVRFRVERTAELLDAVYAHRATHLIAVPTLLTLVDRLADDADAFRTDDFRFVVTSAAPMPDGLWRRFEERFGARVVNVYGLTETVCGGLFCGPDEATYRLGTVGQPVDCEVRLVDEAGGEVPAGERGELLLRGENLFAGYVGDPEGTAAVLREGWFHTGDVAVRDCDGFVRIVGRKKNLVITGGQNVHPEEVARAAEEAPGVAEAVAFGLPDETFGEVLALCYAAADGAAPRDDDVLAACRERLSGYKVPRALARVPAVPRGATGKADLARTRELFERARRGRGVGDGQAASVAERVRAAAERTFRLPTAELTDDAGPGVTRGWDSFAHLTFVLELERDFGLQLAAADVMAIKSLGDAARVVARRLAVT